MTLPGCIWTTAGRFWAINPEAGYFGVVPGTNQDTNQNAYETLKRDAIYTNVGVTDNNEPWWEGKLEGNPIKDWKGDDYVLLILIKTVHTPIPGLPFLQKTTQDIQN